MLEIHNLDIVYQRTILKDISATFRRGAVTAVTGASGSGKSSLLNVLGLLKTPNEECSYTLDGKEIALRDERAKAEFRAGRIGFIFQQNNLIPGLTLLENILLPLRILSGCEPRNREKAEEILAYVNLLPMQGSYPADLSGGEEQRAAIARALVGDADVILADEPTASLDPANRDRILSLLKRLAWEMDKIVIIVTHDEQVASIADKAYAIEDQRLVLLRDHACGQREPESPVKGNGGRRNLFGFILGYERNRRKEKKLNRILIGFTALIAAVSTMFFSFGDAFSESQREFIESISEKGLFLINDTLGLDNQINYESALALSLEEQDSIRKIRGVDKVYPYYEFTSEGNPGKSGEGGRSEVVLADQERRLKTLESREGQSFAVVPLYPEEEVSRLLLAKEEKGDIRKGLILSEAFALQLAEQPESLLGKTLEISCYMPVKLYETEVLMDEGQGRFPSDRSVQKLVTVRRRISGIMEQQYVQQRSEEGMNCIFLDYDSLISMISQGKDMDYSHSTPGFPEKELAPSALMIYADRVEDIPKVKERLERISGDFQVISRGLDLEKISSNLLMIRNTMRILSVTLVAVVMILFSFIYYFRNRSRKKEVGILKALGLTGGDVLLVVGFEMLGTGLRIFLLSLLFSMLLVLGSRLLMLEALFALSPWMILYCMLLSLFIGTGSGIFSVWKTSRVDIIDAIRNNR